MIGGRKWIVAALLALALPLVPSPAGAATTKVLVLGDSYSAGNGAGSYSGPAGCRRSANAYGQVVAKSLGATATNAACAGAVTRDLTVKRGSLPPQVDAVDATYDLILVTIGGNDAGFGGIVGACLVVPMPKPCDAALTRAEQLGTSGVLATRVRQGLQAVQAKARPDARIVVVGYPYLDGANARVRALTDLGDRVQQQVVTELGARFRFVSTKARFAGHELTVGRTNPNRWFVQPGVDATIRDVDLWYHPNKTGHAEMAKAVLAAISA